MTTQIITFPYKTRDAFRPYHDNNKRFAVTVAHRRAGKTVARINRLIKAACECQLERPHFGYLAPFFVQAKDIAWLYLKHYLAPLLKFGGKVNESELSITLPHNGAVIRLYGAENAERMRGLYFDGIVIDEAQGVAQSVLTTVILPALADRQGWLDCSGTPRGWQNMLGQLVKLAQNNPADWYLQILKASQTGILPQAELDLQRSLLNDNEYDQEFECSFDAAITGAFYGREMAAALADGRLCDIAWQSEFPVHTAWDLGRRDDTAIWFYQRVKSEIHILDYYAVSGADVPDLAAAIHKRPYIYGKHYLPHDARMKMLASNGRSIVEQLWVLDVKGEIVPDIGVQNGIQAARAMLPTCYFDLAKCDQGLESLRHYQREWDEDKRCFRESPRHDWASHAADAFRMLAVAWREEQPKSTLIERARGIESASFNEIVNNPKRQRAQTY
jgi:phage terminase large subunit